MKHNTVKLEYNGVEFYFENMSTLHASLNKEYEERHLYMGATSVYCNNTKTCLKHRIITPYQATLLLRKWGIKIHTSDSFDELINLKRFLEHTKEY